MRQYFRLALFGLATSALNANYAAAVTLPETSPSWQPGRIQQRLNIEDTPPAVGGAPVIAVPEKEKAQEFDADIQFELNSVTIEGATVFTPEDLRATYEKYVGQKVTLNTLSEIAGNITVKYRNAGYILSRAVVPAQRITGGDIKIQVIEGYISRVSFNGFDDQMPPDLLAALGDNIVNDRPLNAAHMERYLLLMQDLPGVTTRALLRPAPDATGAADLVVTIVQSAIDGVATLDNRGSRYVGPVQAGVTANFNNLFGWYDRTTLRGVITSETDELQYMQIAHDEPIGSEGTKLSVSLAHTESQPGYRLEQFDVQSQDNSFNVGVSHPFIRSRLSNLYGNLKVDVRSTKVSALDTLLYDDQLRVLRAGGTYDFVDEGSAVNRISTTFSKGLGWDDDSAVGARSRGKGKTSFMKAEIEASRLQPLDGAFSLYVATVGQLSADPLLSSEQFGVGGANFGSAYDPSEITGDSGFALRTELQYNSAGDFEWLPSYQLYSFWDFGKVWVRGASAGQKESPSVASVGLGFRFNIWEPIAGGVEVALPISKHVSAYGDDGSAPRMFFSLAYRY